ncbi:MAG: hypothetical protein MNPFHGCM_01642 [Gemmatimonadaceae bacterium]|nr:hypothetical protein [Gemmatimonadaceae bacterium]
MSAHRAVMELSAQSGVRGAVVALRDGVVVDGIVHVDVRADVLAAFGSAVLERARDVARSVLRAEPRCVVIDAEAGRLCLADSRDMIVVLLADRHAPIGRLRLAVRDAVGALT